MLLYRHLLVVLLSLLLFAVLLSALVLQRLDNTLFSPSFYKLRLSEAGFYDFLLTDFTSSAAEGLLGTTPEASSQTPDNGIITELGISTERVVWSVNVAATPDWVREQAETALDNIIPFVFGDSSGFEMEVNFKSQAETLLMESRTIQRESNAYEVVQERFVGPLIDEAIADETFLGAQVHPERLNEAVYNIVTEAWTHDQIDTAIVSITPYLIGEEDAFKIEVPLNDRVDLAIEELKLLLRDVDGYELIYLNLVEREVIEAVGESVDLPGGIVLTREEMVDILRQVVPPEWIQSRAEAVIDSSAPYLKGEDDDLFITVSLVEPKLKALRIVNEVATNKIMAELESRPKCESSLTSEDIALMRFDRIPECIPGDVRLEGLRSLISERVSGVVDPLILELIPNEINFTDADFRSALQEIGDDETADQFDNLRQVVNEGWVYTHEDFQRQLSGDDNTLSFIEDTRSLIANGWQYTDADLRASLRQSGSEESFDNARNIFRWMSLLPWLLFPLSLALIAGIAFIGGSDLRTRIMWGAGSLGIVSLAIFAVWSIAYHLLIKPQFFGILEPFNTIDSDEGGIAPAQALLFNKISEVFEAGLGIFASGISNASIVLLLISLLTLFVSYFWHSLSANYRKVLWQLRQFLANPRAMRF